MSQDKASLIDASATGAVIDRSKTAVENMINLDPMNAGNKHTYTHTHTHTHRHTHTVPVPSPHGSCLQTHCWRTYVSATLEISSILILVLSWLLSILSKYYPFIPLKWF